MRFNYLVYPDAQERIASCGLLKRIERLERSENGLPYVGGYTRKEEVVSALNEMKSDGFFMALTEPEKTAFQSSLNHAFQNIESSPWKLERNGLVLNSETEPEDFYLLTGWMASFILKPREIWDYKKFSFSSINDFVGSFGATIWMRNHKSFRQGYSWNFSKNGRIFESEVTGDHNLDLRIYRTDITPDKTFDPTGSVVSYRPEFDEDRSAVCAYHSTEPSLIAGLLKYVDQAKIPSELLKENAKPLIDYTRSLGHKIGAATECLGLSGGFGENPRFILSNFPFPMPVLDKDYKTETPCVYRIGTQNNGSYGIYIGPENEFIIAHESKEGKKKNPSIIFYPEEIDEVLKSVCYQCAKGLGRTVPEMPLRILEYKYSDKFEEDLKKAKSEIGL